ncbi:glycoside hydrolase family 36 protein [Vibrio alfacsensis]|uniref:glycoside hydrolase family 36 protein n=1 Tax=Vibrio alfacsensis TaxID=1074311 RepID=UPI002ADE0A6B|nr:glycoside hydrolase family 36 protein [Vibrio alfacsensis]WQE78063.1 glycoside hydrolase family 36 protein [Vibrio alfacsensis]
MIHELSVDIFKVTLDTYKEKCITSQLSSRKEGDVIYLDLTLKSEQPINFPKVTLDVSFAIDDIHSLWTSTMHGHPKSIRNKGVPELWSPFTSHISHASPVGCFYNLNGKSRVAFAFSDVKNIVTVHAGAYEEDTAARIMLHLFTAPTKQMTEYKATLRLDTAPVGYHQSIKGITQWHEEVMGGNIMSVPDSALEPVYSTWYSFHQNLEQKEIEDQCELAVELGCKTIILDDGWQTEDNNRGYKYCGDWQVATSRFPDMRGHVERVQAMGMKYLLWLSVPFVGKGSQKWDEFEPYLLCYNEQWEAGTLDPRYPIVRQFLIDTYVRVVRDYGLDGLKLDFIDEFDMNYATGNALLPDSARDTESLPDAVDLLMMEIRTELSKLNSNILIEFRQRYIGSMIRKYGNMFRVHDCPHDSITNRAGILDLRLLSGNTAVHSDMFIWSPSDSLPSACLQFINTLFSVPQISPDLKKLPAEQLQMTRHWLRFWSEHKAILLNGQLDSRYPEMQYPIVEAELDGHRVISVHAAMICPIFQGSESKITLINGALLDSIVVKTHISETVDLLTYDCLGNITATESGVTLPGLTELIVPKSGYIVLVRNS